MVVVVITLDFQNILSINGLGWPFFAGALVWYYVVPPLIWRWNACAKCNTRMDVELLTRKKAPKQ